MSDDFYYEDDTKLPPQLHACEDAWVEENNIHDKKIKFTHDTAALQRWGPVSQWCQENNLHPSFAMRAVANRAVMRAISMRQDPEFYRNMFQSRKHVEASWLSYLQDIETVGVDPSECANVETMSLLLDVGNIISILGVRHLDIENPLHAEAVEKLLMSDLLLASAAARLCVDTRSEKLKNKYLDEFIEWVDKSPYRRTAVEEVSGETVETIIERSPHE